MRSLFDYSEIVAIVKMRAVIEKKQHLLRMKSS